MKETAYRED